MADTATQQIVVSATPEQCLAVALDFESYPEWASDIKDARVLSRDDDGRGNEVEYRAAAMGRSTSYVLRYNHGSRPLRLSWRLMHGDLMRQLDGEYEFVASDDDPAVTTVTYYLAVDLQVPLPGFVKRRAEARIMHAALLDLKMRVESVSRHADSTA